MATPAWQTSELADEWPDDDDDCTRSISLTAPLATVISTPATDKDNNYSAGTFLVHSALPPARTPGKTRVKDFFSPLPLERMFDPPSPPPHPTTSLVPPTLPNNAKFTFTVPIPPPAFQSTPNLPPQPIATRTPGALKLFHFQYDTYTREHLSALVDSIAPSPSFPSSEPTPSHSEDADDFFRLRSAKRVKLSPRSDYSEEDIRISRPRIYGKQYLGESRELMQQIRSAKDFSTVSTVTSKSNSSPPAPAIRPGYSSSKYRQDAANLMAAIRDNVQSPPVSNKASGKRVFSSSSDVEASYYHDERTLSEPPAPGSTSASYEPNPKERGEAAVDVVAAGVARLQVSQPPYPSLWSDDLNRLVSSSTTTGSTLTAGSYVKHAGPSDKKQLLTIRPAEVAMPARMGDMVYDPRQMRWVRQDQQGDDQSSSADVFGDIESLRDGDEEEHGEDRRTDIELSRVTEEEDDEEEIGLTSFETDEVVVVMTGDISTDSADEDPPLVPVVVEDDPPSSPDPDTSGRPVVRPALKNYNYNTPLSTPVTKATVHPRSVSFSDGKRDGQIRGLGRNVSRSESTVSGSDMLGSSFQSSPGMSTRTKRIADLMEAALQSPRSTSWVRTKGEGTLSFRAPATFKPATSVNASFLTECSFGVAHDRLVQILTDVEPWHPHWETIRCVDLKGRGLESVARLGELMPSLSVCSLNSNALTYLSGVPKGIRTLGVADNRLTSLTSFGHLGALESLDVCGNELDSLRLLELSCLRNLRELKADGNRITSLEGLEALQLIKLSLAGNCLRGVVDIGHWAKVEVMNLSGNRIEGLKRVERLSQLVVLHVEDNQLAELDIGRLAKLRILRASGNRIKKAEVGGLVALRTLYLDGNCLKTVGGLDRLCRLEKLSARNQNATYVLATRDVRDVKRLYVSGNKVPKSLFADEACYNLYYLEVAGCAIRELPTMFAQMVPNVRIINLNYNQLKSIEPLRGLRRVKRLSVVGCRLETTQGIVRTLRGMEELEEVDCRMNPCTLGWYAPVLKRTAEGWAELDRGFRRGLPDPVYVGRLAYRGLVMAGCVGVRVVDGVAVTGKERAKASGVLRSLGKPV
ncbi:L domain-like protein [Guyanagaster necrorhizus]|uniref:L domain-like protein n=1 Tax=Guyanagaster necrorhizus TaxID=856835 RepID=A0A9P7VL72_9AGAR|nr:L domain-like protein [Guyanagaster necrorhizus MCA 3950]KAG7443173.1 L domain-like protein [Guyanagaster necrorhizus MCA 3950]